MRLKWIAIAVVAIAACYVAWRVSRWWRLDQCLDQGGCWVNGEERCEHVNQAACDRSMLER
jgi:hypothetical protein